MQRSVAKEFLMQQMPSTNAVEARLKTGSGRDPQPSIREVHFTVPAEPTAAPDIHFPLGARIVTPGRWYTHHGIYVASGLVVGCRRLSSSLRRSPAEKARLANFTHDRTVREYSEADAGDSGIEVIARGCTRLGENAYDVLRNSCELDKGGCSMCSRPAGRSNWPSSPLARKWRRCPSSIVRPVYVLDIAIASDMY
ncbi:hypothetical protein FSB65_41370, partial [Paraburkholderia sp. JPY418]|nr:hypothetical protein [Paraburkholderia youngii]